jgi:Pyocin activator protein PrtN
MAGSRTLFLLIAEFGCGQIPIDRCAHHFGMSSGEAKKAAARQQLPVPTYRLGSQKSPWLISAEDLANYIDEQRRKAQEDWSRLHS